MDERGEERGLPLEPLDLDRAPQADDLEGDRRAAEAVVRLVDGAHPSGGGLALEDEAPCDDLRVAHVSAGTR
ncbi:hypothetical protein BE20_06885 [Sorangium cellulosum]|nr:hypothetical protein BE20_06885 [Sorangium cellulosum]